MTRLNFTADFSAKSGVNRNSPEEIMMIATNAQVHICSAASRAGTCKNVIRHAENDPEAELDARAGVQSVSIAIITRTNQVRD